MTRGAGPAAAPRAPAVRHRPQHGPNALADYIQQSVDALKPPEPPKSAPPKRRKRPQKTHKPASGDAPPGRWTVCVRNLLDPEELEDDDEYADAVADLPPEFERFGAVAALRVDRASGAVAVDYSQELHARACVETKHGQRYGGREISATLQRSNEELELRPTDAVVVTPMDASSAVVDPTVGNGNELRPKQRRKRRSKIKNAVVRALEQSVQVSAARLDRKFVVRSMVEADEVEDDDEYDDAMEEVTAMLCRYGEVSTVEIHRGSDDEVAQNVGDVVVEYATVEAARAAFDALHDSKSGGRSLTCAWVLTPQPVRDTKVIVERMLDADELEDDDEFADVREEVEGFLDAVLDIGEKEVSIARDTGQVTIHFQDQNDARVAAKTLCQKSYGGRQLIARFVASSDLPTSPTILPPHKPAVVSAPAPPAHVSDELVALLTALLQRLASLQERAHIQNPLQDKRSRRLVLGLHEVRRGVQSQKIKLLVLATDFDECDVLDSKLGEIITIAMRESIPIIRALTRRKLGKVLKKHARVSCFGVYSYDGANDLYRELLREHERLQRTEKLRVIHQSVTE